MSGKFLKIIFVAILSIGLIGQANASLIAGDIVEDTSGNEWVYVGMFNLIDGPYWNDANDCDFSSDPACVYQHAEALNGVQVAELLFGSLIDGLYATSTVDDSVNRLAWYDAYLDITREAGDSIATDFGANLYSEAGDLSAYIQDRSYLDGVTDKVNYVFKSVSVPEPSTLAVFALALCIFGARRLKG